MRTKGNFLKSVLLVTACLSPVARADEAAEIDTLKRQLAERDAEIAALRQQLGRLLSPGAEVSASPVVPVATPEKKTADSRQDDELLGALESSLVRQGASVLARGVVELEPELSYFYDEPDRERRRDNTGLALTTRVGLSDSVQADLRLPYVIRDQWSGVGHSSGWGDVRLGLTAELRRERDNAPGFLAFAQWRTTTGDIDRTPPTGFGQNALQFGVSVIRRQDPVVLFGSLSYTSNLGHAQLRDGNRLDAGNVFGGRLGAYLAATPDTSFYLGIAVNSSAADHFNSRRIDESDRLRGVVELGTSTAIGQGKFLNLSAGFGVTPAAPKFFLSASIPIRF